MYSSLCAPVLNLETSNAKPREAGEIKGKKANRKQIWKKIFSTVNRTGIVCFPVENCPNSADTQMKAKSNQIKINCNSFIETHNTQEHQL